MDGDFTELFKTFGGPSFHMPILPVSPTGEIVHLAFTSSSSALPEGSFYTFSVESGEQGRGDLGWGTFYMKVSWDYPALLLNLQITNYGLLTTIPPERCRGPFGGNQMKISECPMLQR